MQDYELSKLSNPSKCRAIKAIINKEAEYYDKRETIINASKDAAVSYIHFDTAMVRKLK